MKNRLKVLRAERDWTQEDLGKHVGVSRQAINALETGKHDPSLDLAYRIAGSFGVRVEEVFHNPHEPGGPSEPAAPGDAVPKGAGAGDSGAEG